MDKEFIKRGFTQSIRNMHVQYSNTLITEVVGVPRQTACNRQMYLCRSCLFISLLRGFVIKYKLLEYAHFKTNILSHYYITHRSFLFASLKQLIDS